MKTILLLFCSFMLLNWHCSKQKNETPPCVQQRIEEIKAKPKGSDAVEIHAYKYKGNYVYLFISQCCDFYNHLFDSNCNYICSPTGGITGGGDGSCPDFKNTATYIRLVWRDDR